MMILNKQTGLAIGRLLLGGVFLISGFMKVGDPLSFADRIHSFQILPDWTIHTVALGLPILEIMIGVSIFIARLRGPALMTSFLLLILFSAGFLQGLIRGLEINCGCFGGFTFLDSSPEISLIRNMALIIISLWLYREHFLNQISPI